MITPSVNPIHHVEYLNALLSSLDESVVATDENLCVQYMNKKAEQLFGVTAEEAAGRPESNTELVFRPRESAWKGCRKPDHYQ